MDGQLSHWLQARMLVATLRHRGFALRVDDDQLRVSPGSDLTDDDRSEIRTHRDAIVVALRDRPAIARVRETCVTCDAALPSTSWARCPSCLAAAYRAASNEPDLSEMTAGP